MTDMQNCLFSHFFFFFIQIIGEAVPLILSGHPHDVECLGTDGSIVVSSCLAGVICAWDSATGECIASINRFEICTFVKIIVV